MAGSDTLVQGRRVSRSPEKAARRSAAAQAPLNWKVPPSAGRLKTFMNPAHVLAGSTTTWLWAWAWRVAPRMAQNARLGRSILSRARNGDRWDRLVVMGRLMLRVKVNADTLLG